MGGPIKAPGGGPNGGLPGGMGLGNNSNPNLNMHRPIGGPNGGMGLGQQKPMGMQGMNGGGMGGMQGLPQMIGQDTAAIDDTKDQADDALFEDETVRKAHQQLGERLQGR